MTQEETPNDVIAGFAGAQYCRWDAQDVLDALADAGYVIVPKESTGEVSSGPIRACAHRDTIIVYHELARETLQVEMGNDGILMCRLLSKDDTAYKAAKP